MPGFSFVQRNLQRPKTPFADIIIEPKREKTQTNTVIEKAHTEEPRHFSIIDVTDGEIFQVPSIYVLNFQMTDANVRPLTDRSIINYCKSVYNLHGPVARVSVVP
jgi:hypothetical protein